MLFYWLPSSRLHLNNRIYQIPVGTIIVYSKTNTIAVITLKSITFYIVLGGVLLFFLCFFFSAGKIIMVLVLFTELLNFKDLFIFL